MSRVCSFAFCAPSNLSLQPVPAHPSHRTPAIASLPSHPTPSHRHLEPFGRTVAIVVEAAAVELWWAHSSSQWVAQLSQAGT